MFVGEAPGANEDKQGLPFVGQAGRLLDKLLAEIGLERGDVFIANVLKCRPPGNRDPRPQEIEACRDYLHRQVDLIEPRVICTLGNFSTKLLRGDPTGISRLHGQPEVHVLGHRAVRLYPIYHPAAALYTPSMLETLRADFARLPELLATESAAAAGGASSRCPRSSRRRRSRPTACQAGGRDGRDDAARRASRARAERRPARPLLAAAAGLPRANASASATTAATACTASTTAAKPSGVAGATVSSSIGSASAIAPSGSRKAVRRSASRYWIAR